MDPLLSSMHTSSSSSLLEFFFDVLFTDVLNGLTSFEWASFIEKGEEKEVKFQIEFHIHFMQDLSDDLPQREDIPRKGSESQLLAVEISNESCGTGNGKERSYRKREELLESLKKTLLCKGVRLLLFLDIQSSSHAYLYLFFAFLMPCFCRRKKRS